MVESASLRTSLLQSTRSDFFLLSSRFGLAPPATSPYITDRLPPRLFRPASTTVPLTDIWNSSRAFLPACFYLSSSHNSLQGTLSSGVITLLIFFSSLFPSIKWLVRIMKLTWMFCSLHQHRKMIRAWHTHTHTHASHWPCTLLTHLRAHKTQHTRVNPHIHIRHKSTVYSLHLN